MTHVATIVKTFKMYKSTVTRGILLLLYGKWGEELTDANVKRKGSPSDLL